MVFDWIIVGIPGLAVVFALADAVKSFWQRKPSAGFNRLRAAFASFLLGIWAYWVFVQPHPNATSDEIEAAILLLAVIALMLVSLGESTPPDAPKGPDTT